ncbi:hypothetical protein ACFY1P_32790 [Streptomyces sp. NPDC001407]|uniref:hypothetical protein n=1 Tax=Streptomyces sp. NPDC001407 TaxID=3364573 RepID=UPI0036C62519
MRIPTVGMSQVIAMNLRHRIHDATPGAERWDYDPQGRRYARAFTREETERAAGRLADGLAEWRAADPEGYALWEAAMESGARDADPCTFCHSCRTSRPS